MLIAICLATLSPRTLRNQKSMRKSPITLIIASSLLILTGATGRAGTLWDVDVFTEHLSSENTKYTGYFDITSEYDPSVEKLSYAKAWFLFSDDSLVDGSEWVSVDLGYDTFLDPVKITFALVGSGPIIGDAFLTLDETGKLKYTIHRTRGDFWALAAKLKVETSPRGVPDGGATLMLLGVAFAGIESLRRRMASKK